MINTTTNQRYEEYLFRQKFRMSEDRRTSYSSISVSYDINRMIYSQYILTVRRYTDNSLHDRQRDVKLRFYVHIRLSFFRYSNSQMNKDRY